MFLRALGFLTIALSSAFAQVSFSPSQAQPYQTPNPSGKRYDVSGTVMNSLTGAPVPRALVMVNGMEQMRTFSGDDGHFEFKNVLEGRIFLNAQRPGFIPGNRQVTPINLTASRSSEEIKLIPESTLRGRVVSNDGEPVEGLQVQLLRRQTINGVRQWTFAYTAASDDAGNFSMENLIPGAYLARTMPHSVFASARNIVVDGRHFPELYPPQYYPNAPDQNSAQVIQIQQSSEAQLDLTVTAVPAYQASGQIDADGNFSGTCENDDGDVVSSSVRINPRDHRFTATQLPPGNCTLVIHNVGQNSTGGLYGELPISIGSSDLNDLKIGLQQLNDIPVSITGTGTANVMLQPIKMRAFHFNYQPTVKDGNTTLVGVSPGTYHVTVQPTGSVCIASITSGSADLSRGNLTVANGSAPPITVAVRSDCGSIGVQLTGSNLPPQVFVIAIPESGALLPKIAGVSTSNPAQLAGLTPGDYTVYAFGDISEVPYGEPGGLKSFDGQKVTLGPNAKVDVQLATINAVGEGK